MMKKPSDSDDNLFPFEPEVWAETMARAQFSLQHERIAKCLFHGDQDKQIAVKMGLSVFTVRTYLGRMSSQFGVQGRVELMLKIVAIAQDVQRGESQ